jgi:hypothetical protein
LLDIDELESAALKSSWGGTSVAYDELRQLKAVLETQRSAGLRLFIMAATTETSQSWTLLSKRSPLMKRAVPRSAPVDVARSPTSSR